MSLKVGDIARCQQCGGKIVLVNHPSIIALDLGLWIHVSAIRRFARTHPAVGPTS